MGAVLPEGYQDSEALPPLPEQKKSPESYPP